MNLGNFFTELKRRNVYKVAVAYTVVGWLLIQVATQVFPFFEIPNWAVRLVVLAIIVGFPIALVIAWAFELTPEGLKRADKDELKLSASRSRAWIYVVLVAAALSLGLFFLGRLSAPGTQNRQADASAKSIAVLPFENLSEDKENAYFADGIQDEILTRLSKIADLKVISRTSTRQFQSKPGNIAEIAKQLGVATILEGSVQKARDSVRVNVQLIKAEGDSHLWAETYDRKLTDVFAVESEVAQQIASALEATLTGQEKAAIATVGTRNPEAYDALLRAGASTDHVIWLKLVQRAIELDQNYAEAWATLAIGQAYHFASPWQSEVSQDEVHHAAETALRLAPDLAKAHLAMSLYDSLCLGDGTTALAELERAHELAPNDASILARLGSAQRAQGHTEEAIAIMIRAAELDPLNADAWYQLGNTYRGLRKFEQARAMFDRALPIVGQDDVELYCLKAETYQAEGQLDAAERLLGQHPLPPPAEWGLAIYYQQFFLQRDYHQLGVILKTLEAAKEKLPPIFVAVTDLARGNLSLLQGEKESALQLAPHAEMEMKQLREQHLSLNELSALYIEFESRLGHRAEMEAEIAALFERTRKNKWEFPVSESSAAKGYALLGDLDRALPLLQAALQQPSRQSLTPALLRLDPSYDGVRSDPRFQQLAAPAHP